jgi:protease-4
VLDLSEGVVERPSTGVLGLSPGTGSLAQLIEAVGALEGDDQVRGVLVRLGTARIGLAKATEIAAALEALGRKIPVFCHADEMGNATAYLAAKGCSRVWVSPGGSVDAIGIAAQMVYFHKLLAEELGLDVDFLQVGKYKGAEEPFTRDGPSDEARASLETTLAGLRAAWLQGILAGRHGASEIAVEDGPYSAPGAKDRGLIDDVGYFDEAKTAVESAAHAARAQVVWGPGADSSDGDPMTELVRAFTGSSMGEAPIAVVVASGAISTEGEGAFGQSGGIVSRRLVSTLARLEKDDDVKAVVLRIDSPGGSALASDLLWHALMRLRASKPLVVSVGEMAASGGYYMASAGSVVYADPSSIVGSIGVVGGKVAAGHALERVGVFADTVPAKVGDRRAGSRAAYESVLSPWDDATRLRLLETMHSIYALFLARIAEGRGIPSERVAASAEGRIFAGAEGKSRGLVDELGGLSDAIARARRLAGLAPDARFALVRDAGGFLQELLQGETSQTRGKSGQLLEAAGSLVPELVPFVASMAPIAAHEPVLCSMPFALTVR